MVLLFLLTFFLLPHQHLHCCSDSEGINIFENNGDIKEIDKPGTREIFDRAFKNSVKIKSKLCLAGGSCSILLSMGSSMGFIASVFDDLKQFYIFTSFLIDDCGTSVYN